MKQAKSKTGIRKSLHKFSVAVAIILALSLITLVFSDGALLIKAPSNKAVDVHTTLSDVNLSIQQITNMGYLAKQHPKSPCPDNNGIAAYTRQRTVKSCLRVQP